MGIRIDTMFAPGDQIYYWIAYDGQGEVLGPERVSQVSTTSWAADLSDGPDIVYFTHERPRVGVCEDRAYATRESALAALRAYEATRVRMDLPPCLDAGLDPALPAHLTEALPGGSS